ncbi:sugar transferase [Desulfovibrio inopinatus]|uniref:sugar transferase n=1 Tax=Desulfovibrio inopinatus TaxID=102109 RepID=UPI0004040402|nr:sugar transferase [Desulfovibrio inopinatus]
MMKVSGALSEDQAYGYEERQSSTTKGDILFHPPENQDGGKMDPHEWGIELVNRGFAALCLILAAPIMMCIALLIYLQKSGPIFYAGPRLGKNKKEFQIYKFRTLPVDVNKRIGDSIVGRRLDFIPSFSWFLRESRLDELPQLLNIVRGDMRFIGPRPERYEVYKRCLSITDYALRYKVKPGLLGISQLLTPSETPKRYRARLDNEFHVRRKRLYSPAKTVWLILKTIALMGSKVLHRGWVYFSVDVVQSKILRKETHRRFYYRIEHGDAPMSLYTCADSRQRVENEAVLEDINEACLLMSLNAPLNQGEEYCFFMRIFFKRMGKSKTKTAVCRFVGYRSERAPNAPYKYTYVVDYEAMSPFNQYIIDKYFLKKSLA